MAGTNVTHGSGPVTLPVSWKRLAGVVSVLIFVALSLAQVAASRTTNPPTSAPNEESPAQLVSIKPRAGEICVVCDQPITERDRVYRVLGQRVPVHAGTEDHELRTHLAHYIARLRPRGTFLGTEPDANPPLHAGWLIFGAYALVGLIFAGICGHRALNCGMRPLHWFFAGFFVNIVGYLILVTRSPAPKAEGPAGLPPGLKKIPATYSPQPCRACGMLNHPSAASCPGCGGKLQPQVSSEVARLKP